MVAFLWCGIGIGSNHYNDSGNLRCSVKVGLGTLPLARELYPNLHLRLRWSLDHL